MSIVLVQPGEGQSKAPRKHRRTKPQLLQRSMIDGRSNAAKMYDGLITAIENDLGGGERLSTIEHGLKEAFAGAYVQLRNINTRLLLGQEIDLTEHSTVINVMVKTGSRLGLSRRMIDKTPTLQQYLASLPKEEEPVEP
jgi:hypothetical protein